MYCTMHVTADNEVFHDHHDTYEKARAYAKDVLSNSGGRVEFFYVYGAPMHAEDLHGAAPADSDAYNGVRPGIAYPATLARAVA